MSEPTIAEERARELLVYSSSGVRAELEQAEGWIRAGQVAGEPELWRIDAAAGAIGALANAYGRMILWSQVTGMSDVNDALRAAMDTLVQLRRGIEAAVASTDEIGKLRQVALDMESIHEHLVRTTGVTDD